MKLFLLFNLMAIAVIEIKAQNPYLIAECDFDGIVNNCEFSFDASPQNIWQIGTPQKPFFGNAWSVPNAIQTDTVNSYPANNLSEFILKFVNNDVNTTDWTITMLSFWHKYQTDPANDLGQISYSIDDGNTWLPLIDTFGISGPSGYTYEYFYWDFPLMETSSTSFKSNVVSGVSSGWIYSKYSWLWYLPVEGVRDFTPQTILVKFSFISDGMEDGLDGWIIDNITVEKAFFSGVQDPLIGEISLQVYPNPVTDYFNFAFAGNEAPQVVQLLNPFGQVIKEFAIHTSQAQIDVRGLPKGNYFFKVIAQDGHSVVHKLVLQ